MFPQKYEAKLFSNFVNFSCASNQHMRMISEGLYYIYYYIYITFLLLLNDVFQCSSAAVFEPLTVQHFARKRLRCNVKCFSLGTHKSFAFTEITEQKHLLQ